MGLTFLLSLVHVIVRNGLRIIFFKSSRLRVNGQLQCKGNVLQSLFVVYDKVHTQIQCCLCICFYPAHVVAPWESVAPLIPTHFWVAIYHCTVHHLHQPSHPIPPISGTLLFVQLFVQFLCSLFNWFLL